MSTAAATYTARAATIASQIKAIEGALTRHASQHAANPADWGAAGDLGYVHAQLAEVLAFLGSSK